MKKHEAGQGLVEYVLILVLVSIVVITVLRLLGPIIGNTFSEIDGELDASSTSGITQIEASKHISSGAGDDLSEIIEPFKEAGLLQEEYLHEGTDLTVEAFAEFLEVVIEHFDEIENEEAAEALSVLRQAFLDGDFEAIPALFESLFEDLGNVLAGLPAEVQLAAAEKMLPRLEKSSQALSQGLVPPDLVTGTIAAVAQEMPDDHPNKAEVLQKLNEAGELVLARNEAIEEIITAQDKVITQLQALLDGE